MCVAMHVEEPGFGPYEQYTDITSIHSIYNVSHMTGLKDVFPAISTALIIALTLLYPVHHQKDHFHLHRTMIEYRLEALMTISYEIYIPVEDTEVINIFSSC